MTTHNPSANPQPPLAGGQRDSLTSTHSPSAMAKASGTPSLAPAWRIPLLALGLVFAAIVLLYWETAVGMVSIWYRSDTFAHGFIVLPIVLWLVWRKRAELQRITPRPHFAMLILLAGLGVMWLLGDLVAVNSVTQLAMVSMLVVAVPAVLGLPVAAAIAFPLAFAFFAVPIGEFVMPQLMDWTAEFTILALRLSGIPVYREGLNFVIPSGHWSVVEACSGVRYLIASMTVGTLFAYLTYQSNRRRLLFILVSILVPVVANWMRAYMIVMLGHLSGNKIAVGVDHLIYGWAFFGVVILVMFFIGARWAEPEPAIAASATDLPATPASNGSPENSGPLPSVLAPPGEAWRSQGGGRSTARLALALASIVLVVAFPIIAKQVLESRPALAPPQLTLGSELAPGWKAFDAAAIGFAPHFENPSAEINRGYSDGASRVGIYLGFYRDQDYSRKLVSSNNELVTSKDTRWTKVGHDGASALLGKEPVALRRAELRRMAGAVATAPERLLVWQIYWIHGRWTRSDYVAKVYSAAYQLLGQGDDSAVVVVYTDLDRGERADHALAAFLAANGSAIDAALRHAAASR